MNQLIKKNSQLKNELKKKINQQNLKEYVDKSEYYIKKTINPYYVGLSLLVYSTVIVLATMKLSGFQTAQNSNRVVYHEMKQEIIAEVKKANKYKSTINSISRNTALKNEMEIFREELISQINSLNLKYLDLVEDRKKEFNRVVKGLIERKPSSITTAGKVLPYTQENSNLLHFKFQKKIDREKERLKAQEQRLIANLDLTKEENIEKMKDIQDQTEIAIYELKQRYYKKKNDFRKNKYIVLNN